MGWDDGMVIEWSGLRPEPPKKPDWVRWGSNIIKESPES